MMHCSEDVATQVRIAGEFAEFGVDIGGIDHDGFGLRLRRLEAELVEQAFEHRFDVREIGDRLEQRRDDQRLGWKM